MSILNYFFIGTAFTFIMELLYQKFYKHPSLKNEFWGFLERIICVIIWPLAAIVFCLAFIKSIFKK